MALGRAQTLLGYRDQLVTGRRFGVARTRPVTNLTLNVAELLHVHDGRTARPVVAGHVAAHAVEVELLVRRRQRGVRRRVLGEVPELALTLVARAAHLHPDVVT